MPKQRHYLHPSSQASDAKLAEDTREIINQSLKLLREPAPDTFLGRENVKAFPQERTKQEK